MPATEMNTLNTLSTDEKSFIQVIVNGQVESAQVRGYPRVVNPSIRAAAIAISPRAALHGTAVLGSRQLELQVPVVVRSGLECEIGTPQRQRNAKSRHPARG